MDKQVLAIIGISVLIGSIAVLFIGEDYEEERAFNERSDSIASGNLSSDLAINENWPNQLPPNYVEQGSAESDLADTKLKSILEEVNTLLSEYQTDEALNELNALLEEFEALSDEEKGGVLIAYASYFARLNKFDDAKFFYAATLELQNLDQANRLATIQVLARFALDEEDWDTFLAYNDQYFAEGGEYNWIVTGHLISAYRRLGNIDAAGQTLILQLETGINTQFDFSNDSYQRIYGETQQLPLMMSNAAEAVELALAMVSQFDRMENWKVLAEVYDIQNDQLNLERIMTTARDRGFINSNGDWLIQDSDL
ncbi:MAG: hypothetical protein GKR91_05050 [Pseudomonadales bacterium]|nr:hypothetical protein [Pseudomonadales bacterium]